jgi:hypothetical protein
MPLGEKVCGVDEKIAHEKTKGADMLQDSLPITGTP